MTRILAVILSLAMLAAVGAVFLHAPTEVQMGDVQRIFYFHVSSALSAAACYFLAGVSAELGVLFSAFVLFSGPLWARPIWGVFWRWEPRLTTMLITFALYVAYLMVRSYGDPGERTQRFAAVVGIVAFVNVPLVHYSINMWAADQQLHPPKVELDPAMQQTKLICYLAFGCLVTLLMRLRLNQERQAARLQALATTTHQ